MIKQRKMKPVDVFDHTNAMGVGMACMIMIPLFIAAGIGIAMVIHAWVGAWAWLMLPVTIVAFLVSCVAIYDFESTWTREEAAERNREDEWDFS